MESGKAQADTVHVCVYCFCWNLVRFGRVFVNSVDKEVKKQVQYGEVWLQ